MQLHHRMPRLGSARTVLIVGVVLGLTIAGSLYVVVMRDRDARMEAARRQSMALAVGVDRLLAYELRSLERALTGIAADSDAFLRTAPAQATTLLSEAIAGVVARRPELEAITLFDAHGHAIAPSATSQTLPAWTTKNSVTGRPLVFGPLLQAGDQAWLVPIAIRTPRGNWMVARLRTSEFQRMITGLDTGRDGSVSILDRRGVVLARAGTKGTYIGRQVPLPDELRDDTVTLEMVSALDRIKREATFSAKSGYPLVTVAGIGLREALAPWRIYAGTALALVCLYWFGLIFLVRRLASAEYVVEHMFDELQANAEWLRQAQLAARTGVWRLEVDQGQVRASEFTSAMFGFPPTTGTIPIERFFESMHPDDRARVEMEFAAAQGSGTDFRSELRIIRPDGEIRWIISRGAVAKDNHGNDRMTGTIVDVSEYHEALAQVERAESQFLELFELNPLPFWVFDVETLRFLAVNQAAITNYGYSREEFLAMTILDIRPPEEAGNVRESILALPLGGHGDRTWVHITHHGVRMDARVHSSSIQFAGRAARLVFAKDVTDQVAYERDLAWRATHDVTTGLLNLPSLLQRLDGLGEEGAAGFAVAYVQLRDIELVAPTLGRRAGETILLVAAERFGQVGKDYGLAAYVPAESFVIAALDVARRDRMVTDLIRATAMPVEAEGGTYQLEAWIGLADATSDSESAEQVIGNAALAALRARRESVPVMQFDATMAAEATGRLALARRLRQAVDEQEFELFFQPVQGIADGCVVSVEALLRWRQADGSFVPPMQFIPLCEESGLIVPLGAWVLEEAARCHGVLAARGLGHLSIAVNVSAVQFLSEALPQSLRDLSKAYALPRGALHVELTESVLLRRPESARLAMDELHADGVCISIDDFGTGFSSMAYLMDLPVDFLKIDRAFVADVHRDLKKATICQALIALGHGLGMEIIAEGVECASEMEWLRAQGCDQAQGYYLGRPAPLSDVIASIEQSLALIDQCLIA